MNIEMTTKILQEIVNKDMFPSVRFKPESPLGFAIASICATTARKPEESDTDFIARTVEEFVSNSNAVVEQQIEDIAETIANGMFGSIRKIRDLHKTVDSLTEAIEKQVTAAIALDPKLNKLLNEQDTDFSYATMDYSAVDEMGLRDSIIGGMNELVHKPTVITTDAYKSVMERYVSMRIANTEFKTIAISPEARKELLDALEGENGTREDLASVLNILTNENACAGFVTRSNRLPVFAPDYTKPMFDSIATIAKYGKALSKVIKKLVEMDIIPSENDGNYDQAYAVIEKYLYFVHYHRVITFKDTVLFNNSVLNGDMVEEMKAKGLTPEYIARYIRVLYKGELHNPLGATLTSLEDNKDKIEKLYAETQAADDLYAKMELAKIKARAFSFVVNNYLEKLNIKAFDFVSGVATKFMEYSTPVDELLYTVLINTQEKDTIVNKLHDQLGKAYSDLVVKNPELDEVVVNQSTMKAYLEVAYSALEHILV